jgi:type VI secretion system protein ImpK
MADKDKVPGSGSARDAEVGLSAVPSEGTTRRFPNAGNEEKTQIRPRPGRARARPLGPGADAGAQVEANLTAAPRRAAQQATDLSVGHDNPLMQAAGPLLLLFGRLRTSLLKTQVSTVVPQIVAAVATVETEAVAAGVSREIAERAKYCLCVTADEVISNLPGSDGGGVAEGGIARHYFGGRLRDDNFLASITAETNSDRDLMELQHACLALVFVGSSKVIGADAANLQTARRDLYQRLAKSGPAVRKTLSPRWQGLALPAPATRLQIPFWAVTGIMGMALFMLYLTMRTVIGLQAETVAQTMRQLTPPAPLTVRSDIGTTPTPTPVRPTQGQVTQLERIRKALAEKIAAGDVSVEATSNQITIRVPSRAIFPAERATVNDDFVPLALQIALAIDKEPGPIEVIGHTDDAPLTSGRYVSSVQLAREQAKAVAALLRRSLTEPTRVMADGKGADVPLVPNTTPEGRAKNRRIEIVITRSD